jgi:LacI family transcriptional regulator
VSRGNATLKDLAEKLDVSIATVSRALSGNDRIAQSTRARIESAARELGYYPNRAARALVSGQTGLIALVQPAQDDSLRDGSTGRFIEELSMALSRHGMDLLVSVVTDGLSEMHAVEQIVRSRKADGLVLTGLRPKDPRIALLEASNFPFVAFGRPEEGLTGRVRSAPDWVDCNGASASARAIRLLAGLGHGRIGLVGFACGTTFGRRWTDGATRALRALQGPRARLGRLSVSPVHPALREEAIRGFLLCPSRPTALLAEDDCLALAILEEAERLGLSVPGDLAVIGFGNSPAGAHRSPALTTFDPDLPRCVGLLADVMRDALRHDDRKRTPARRSIAPKLILRGTHAAAPRGVGAVGPEADVQAEDV